MTFEEDKLSEAMKALQETEKRCESDNGFMKSLRKRLRRKKKSEVPEIPEIFLLLILFLN